MTTAVARAAGYALLAAAARAAAGGWFGGSDAAALGLFTVGAFTAELAARRAPAGPRALAYLAAVAALGAAGLVLVTQAMTVRGAH